MNGVFEVRNVVEDRVMASCSRRADAERIANALMEWPGIDLYAGDDGDEVVVEEAVAS